MTKDEAHLSVMGAISMTLKDSTLQQGFEIICKNLSELEKENAELNCKMKRNIYCYSCANATERCFRNEIGCPCEKYKSYKDENAELKTYNEKLLNGDIEKHNKIVALEHENNKLKEKIEHLTKHLDYQDICYLFKQVEEEVAQEQRIKNLEIDKEYLSDDLDKQME